VTHTLSTPTTVERPSKRACTRRQPTNPSGSAAVDSGLDFSAVVATGAAARGQSHPPCISCSHTPGLVCVLICLVLPLCVLRCRGAL
jgi:hypothetical protein